MEGVDDDGQGPANEGVEEDHYGRANSLLLFLLPWFFLCFLFSESSK